MTEERCLEQLFFVVMAGSDWRSWIVLDGAPYLPGTIGVGEAGDQMQRHVDPRGNTRRRHQITVVDEALIAAHIDGRIEFGEQVEPSPVSRRRAAAEHTRGSIDQGASAHAGQPGRWRRTQC